MVLLTIHTCIINNQRCRIPLVPSPGLVILNFQLGHIFIVNRSNGLVKIRMQMVVIVIEVHAFYCRLILIHVFVKKKASIVLNNLCFCE